MSAATVIRCCPGSAGTLCPACIRRLPPRLRDNLASTYRDADLIGHAYATETALAYLMAIQPRPDRRREEATR